MSQELDKYLAAHKRFKAERKLGRGIEGFASMLSGLLNQVKVEPDLEAVLTTHLPTVVSDPDKMAFFKYMLCVPEGLSRLKDEIPELYDMCKDQLVNYKRAMLTPLRPAAKRAKRRMINYPFCRTAMDVLLAHQLRLGYGPAPSEGFSEGRCHMGSNIIIVHSIEDRPVTIVHEAGHLFYNVSDDPPAEIVSKSGKRFSLISPLEAALDRMAMNALKKDPTLADYLVEGVKQKGNFMGELSKDEVAKLLG